MKCSIIQEQNFKLLWSVHAEFLQVLLEAIAVAIWELQGKVITIYRGIGTEQVEVFKPVLVANDRLYAFACQAAPGYGKKPETAFIHCIEVDRAATRALKLFSLNMFQGPG